MDPEKTPESPEKRSSRPGRIRSMWHALLGRPVVPNAIRAEWTAWQIELENLCDKVSAAAARAYERDRVKLKAAEKRIKELESAGAATQGDQAEPGWGGGGSWHPDKRAMNRLVLERRGVRLPSAPQQNGEANVPGVEG